MLAADLRLRDDELQRVAVVRAGDGMGEDADRLEQLAHDADFVREVRRVGDDLLGLGRKLHALALVATLLHRGPDPARLAALVVQDLLDGGVEHVRAAVDGRQPGEALRQLAQPVQRVDVRRLAVARHRVDVQPDARHGVGGHAARLDVVVGLVERHRVADEVACRGFESEFVVDLLHRDLI